MKKLLYSINSIAIIFLIIICLDKFDKQDNVLKDEHIPNESSSLTMMYETAAGSGIYETATDTLFPSEGYTYNATLSKCENGSTLEYDESTHKVMIYANKSDKCYVYFDVLDDPIIITSYDLSLSLGANNYIKNVQTNKEVVVQKYVLILDDTTYLEATEENPAWSCTGSEHVCNCLSPKTTYNYELYLITQDGKQSESCFGTTGTDAEVCNIIEGPLEKS